MEHSLCLQGGLWDVFPYVPTGGEGFFYSPGALW
jgi:hypothetical protein